jgi:5-hydroxyisourate hydrolase
MSRATISTHVLDVALGKPATGVPVTLGMNDSKTTDAQGRIAELVPGGVDLGRYRLVFDLRDYFAERPHLIDRVTLEIAIDEARHYHVPLLIAPFGLSSYRGT